LAGSPWERPRGSLPAAPRPYRGRSRRTPGDRCRSSRHSPHQLPQAGQLAVAGQVPGPAAVGAVVGKERGAGVETPRVLGIDRQRRDAVRKGRGQAWQGGPGGAAVTRSKPQQRLDPPSRAARYHRPRGKAPARGDGDPGRADRERAARGSEAAPLAVARSRQDGSHRGRAGADTPACAPAPLFSDAPAARQLRARNSLVVVSSQLVTIPTFRRLLRW
jgi:hypothetical protein